MLHLPLLLAGALHHPLAARVAFASSSSCTSSSGALARRIPPCQRRVLRSILRHRGGGGEFDSPTAAFYKGTRRAAASTTTTARYSSVSPVFEVEEKFDLVASPSAVLEVERRLLAAGFVRQYAVEMVDWYFDEATTYSLALNDCWLRYRQEQRRTSPTRTSRTPTDNDDDEDGESAAQGWQLKRGTSTSKNLPSSSRATVYEETEGIQAVALACSLLVDPASRRRTLPRAASQMPSRTAAAAATEWINDSRYPIPVIPPIPISATNSQSDGGGDWPPRAPPELVPFARIVTCRSHWIHKDRHNAEASDRFAGLVVDLDATDFGHAVGEVEALVVAPSEATHDGDRDANQEAVVAAQLLIRDFLRQVIDRRDGEDDDNCESGAGVETGTGGDEPPPRNRVPAQGKLECYLEKYRPELYAALVEAGILRRPLAPVAGERLGS